MAPDSPRKNLAAALFVSGVFWLVTPLARRLGMEPFSVWGLVVAGLVFASGWLSVIMIIRDGHKRDSTISLGLNGHKYE